MTIRYIGVSRGCFLPVAKGIRGLKAEEAPDSKAFACTIYGIPMPASRRVIAKVEWQGELVPRVGFIV